ncbi:hypothetical protein ACWF94_09475 [Streptomyces sp. NPDC055078]
MKPLRHALADALHLRDLRDLRHHRHPGQARRGTDRQDCSRTDCPNFEQRGTGRPRTDRPLPDRPRTDRPGPDRPRTDRPGPDRSASDRYGADRPVSDWHPTGPGGSERRQPARPCQEDPLFEFLRSMHHFLTAPQEIAKPSQASQGNQANQANQADRSDRSGRSDGGDAGGTKQHGPS